MISGHAHPWAGVGYLRTASGTFTCTHQLHHIVEQFSLYHTCAFQRNLMKCVLCNTKKLHVFLLSNYAVKQKDYKRYMFVHCISCDGKYWKPRNYLDSEQPKSRIHVIHVLFNPYLNLPFNSRLQAFRINGSTQNLLSSMVLGNLIKINCNHSF